MSFIQIKDCQIKITLLPVRINPTQQEPKHSLDQAQWLYSGQGLPDQDHLFVGTHDPAKHTPGHTLDQAQWLYSGQGLLGQDHPFAVHITPPSIRQGILRIKLNGFIQVKNRQIKITIMPGTTITPHCIYAKEITLDQGQWLYSDQAVPCQHHPFVGTHHLGQSKRPRYPLDQAQWLYSDQGLPDQDHPFAGIHHPAEVNARTFGSKLNGFIQVKDC